MSEIIRELEKEQLQQDIPEFKSGDTVRLMIKVIEGGKERLQSFEGVVIKKQGSGIRKTVTVRKLSHGVGVERTLPIHSPKIAKFEVLRRGDVKRAKLYYLRDRSGKAARIKEKRD